MDKTDWFPGNINPEYVGAYERNYMRMHVLDWWDGSGWKYGEKTEIYASCQNLQWRGLAERAE